MVITSVCAASPISAVCGVNYLVSQRASMQCLAAVCLGCCCCAGSAGSLPTEPSHGGPGQSSLERIASTMEIIDPRDITLVKFLGSGGYGEVHLGKWHSSEAAIKCLNPSLFFQVNMQDVWFRFDSQECIHIRVFCLFTSACCNMVAQAHPSTAEANRLRNMLK